MKIYVDGKHAAEIGQMRIAFGSDEDIYFEMYGVESETVPVLSLMLWESEALALRNFLNEKVCLEHANPEAGFITCQG